MPTTALVFLGMAFFSYSGYLPDGNGNILCMASLLCAVFSDVREWNNDEKYRELWEQDQTGQKQ